MLQQVAHIGSEIHGAAAKRIKHLQVAAAVDHINIGGMVHQIFSLVAGGLFCKVNPLGRFNGGDLLQVAAEAEDALVKAAQVGG